MKRKTTFKLTLPICLVTMAIISPVTLSSCSNTGIVLANFESYMSSDLMDELRNEQPIRFVNYATNEDILAKFANSYDIAVPSTYSVLELIKQGLVGKIDWRYLGEKYRLTAAPERPGRDGVIPSSYKPIDKATPHSQEYDPLDPDNSDNAQWLFSDTIDNIIDAVDEYAHANGYYHSDESILEYSLPYFLQDWMFAYHGDYIPNLPSSIQHSDGEWYSTKPGTGPGDNVSITWDDITNEISSKKSNPDSRFIPTTRGPNMTMVDDSRTVYDMSHLIYDKDSSKPNVNPTSDQTSIDKMKEVYSKLTDKFEPNIFRLNSDSQQVLYSFAKPLGNPNNATSAEANGIIAYNGDVLYAAMGAGIDEWADTWNCASEIQDGELIDGNFHIVKPRNTPVALDMMVINKKDNNSSKKNAVYDILYKILLEGCNLPWKISENTPDLEWIGATNQDDEFVCGPTLNFDYVSYTPTLWNLNKFVAREEEDPNEYNSYFDMMYDDHNKAELLAEINNVNFKPTDGGLLELPLSNLAKSNMSFVYMQYKEKL